MKQLKKKADKAKQKKTILEPTAKMIEKELQRNITDLCASENDLHKVGKQFGKKVMRSKALIKIQRKLFDRLFELEVARTSGLQRSPLILCNVKNPRKILKKLPLQAKELECFERILTGEEELKKLNHRFTDYLIYLEQIKKRRLELNRPNDYTDYTKFKYIGPGGIVHTKPSADPKFNPKYYEKVTKQRIGAPRTATLKNRNIMKRVKNIDLTQRYSMQTRTPAQRPMKSRENIERITVPVKSSRIAHFSRQVLDLQNVYHSAQKKVSQLTQELQLHTNKPEYKRRCEEIRKELCNKIDDTVRKQKSYERENARLKKMMDRRTFTRIERAFIATTTLVNHLTKAPGLNYQRNYRPKRKYVKCKQC